MSDVEGLREQIEAIKGIAGATAGDAASVREGLMTYTKITGERLDAMHAVINQERTALRSLADQVRSISDSNYYEYNAIAIMGSEIAKFVQLHDEVQTFKEGVADLVHGLLTPGLISLTEINAAITEMTQRLLSEKRGKCYAIKHRKTCMLVDILTLHVTGTNCSYEFECRIHGVHTYSLTDHE